MFGPPPLSRIKEVIKPSTTTTAADAPEPKPGEPAAKSAASVVPAAPAAAAPALDPLDAPFTVPLINGIKTPREAQAALLRSQQEAQRLFYEEVRPLQEARKKLEQDIADRDARLTAIQAELEVVRTTPPFKELKEEELMELAKENPLASQKYLVEKSLRDQNAAAQKEAAIRRSQQQKEYYSKIRAKIDENYDRMSRNEEEFPLFNDLLDIRTEIANETQTFQGADGKMYSPLLGHEWSPRINYEAALGRAYLKALKSGKAVKDSAAETARLTAEASAAVAAGGSGGNGAGAGSGGAQLDPKAQAEKDYKDRLRAAGSSHNFFKGG